MKEEAAAVINVRRIRATARSPGIEVQESPLGVIQAQRLYKMRCECGRSWFELKVAQLARCPACQQLSMVQTV